MLISRESSPVQSYYLTTMISPGSSSSGAGCEILPRLSCERSRFEVVFAVYSPKDIDSWAQAKVKVIRRRLPKLQAGKHRLGVLYGQNWDDDIESGGRLLHP
ncbi:hypothetical protein AcW1_000961 [Taiwanofungus camphoratus]|nr:hypothetical protein AcW1_000961 [Antrodia cinnamomea]